MQKLTSDRGVLDLERDLQNFQKNNKFNIQNDPLRPPIQSHSNLYVVGSTQSKGRKNINVHQAIF